MNAKTDTEALHSLHATLLELGICQPGSLELYHERTRDRDDVAAYRCSRSGVVILDTLDHISEDYYFDKEHNELAELGNRDRVVVAHDEDTTRRGEQYAATITNKRWLDVGCGSGAMLDRLGDRALQANGVEPQGEFQRALRQKGYEVAANIRDVAPESVDIATLFHVFEHLPEPLEDLRALRTRLVPGGKVVIEVPHARDFLLTFLEVEEFRNFTLWSEHLLLHTRESLRMFLETAGYREITIRSFQRYPLANHLHWLSKGAPGGHLKWSELRSADIDGAYGRMLAELNATDTLIAEARA